MQTLIYTELKLKSVNFDNSSYQFKEKSNNLKFGIDSKFYQKLFLIFIASSIFLIFPESPKDSESLCKKYHSAEACIVW